MANNQVSIIPFWSLVSELYTLEVPFVPSDATLFGVENTEDCLIEFADREELERAQAEEAEMKNFLSNLV